MRPVADDDPSEAQHIDLAPVHSNLETGEGLYSLLVDGRSYQVHAEKTEEGLRIVVGQHRIDLKVLTEREWRLKKLAPREALHTGALTIKAPMPGLVKSVLVSVGGTVAKGDRL